MPHSSRHALRLPIALLTATLALALSATAIGGSKRAAEEVNGAVTLDTADAKRLFDEGTLFIDVRRARDRREGTIPGATYLELRRDFERSTLEGIAEQARPMVLFSDGEYCLRAGKAAERALSWGYRKVYYYRGGFPAWKKGGLPTAETPND